MYKRMTYDDRIVIERLYNRKESVKKIADYLGYTRSAIYYEIKKGLYSHLNTDYTYTIKYSADKAQSLTEYNYTSHGVDLKIANDYKFIQHAEKKIKNGYSPYAILAEIENKKLQFNTQISLSTFYNYIRAGVIPNVTMKYMIYKERKSKKKRIEYRKRLYGKSIEKRSSEVFTREQFGHWEIDSVKGKQKTKESLIVLTERKTDYELIFKVPDGKAERVTHVIDILHVKFGSAFSNVFKTITCDNGSEFSDTLRMEYDYCGQKRTDVYYCHPYSSFERGINENQNRFIRRYIPKGTPIKRYSHKFISEVQATINNYPRKIFNGKSSQELFDIELKKIFEKIQNSP